MLKKIISLLMIMALFSCAPAKKIEVVPPPPDSDRRLAEADATANKASYVSLKNAVRIYGDLYQFSALRKNIAARFLTTTLLFALREKEIGISNAATIELANRLIRENPFLSGFAPYKDIVANIMPKGKGVMGDYDARLVSPLRFSNEELEKIHADLKAKSRSDEFLAYLSAALTCFYPYDLKDKEDPAELLKVFPDSIHLKYKIATCLYPNEDLLREITRKDPDFFEAYYHLGEAALTQGQVVTAEENYLKAWAGIPETPQIPIALASIYFAMEDLERSVEFYDMTLQILPAYREAMLGKAICLSYLGRSSEAMTILEKLISMQYLLMGESHYWMAWNLHEQKRNEEAAVQIEQSKGRLPTNSEVFSLAGTIAFERGELDKAEKNFQEALNYNKSNTEALSSLGALHAKREDWANSGSFFERAAWAYRDVADQIMGRIVGLEKSALVPERKNKLIQRKKSQLEKTQLTLATAFYNAAAGYINSGVRTKAMEMAAKAAEHPALKQKADELIAQIKK